MNWYKLAKLVDKEPNPDKSLFSACMFCNRWNTEESPNWKTYDQLESDEDKTNAKIALTSIDVEDYKSIDSGISHGICPYCTNIIKDKGWPRSKNDISNVIELSLGGQI